MASFDGLPSDQKAVLSMVLQRGKTYDEIGAMLSLDRARVRQRALAACDALGPQTSLDPLRRALITDYLLGQLPGRVATGVRDSFPNQPAERAWARVIAGELTSLAVHGLPEIPAKPAHGPDVQAAGETPSARRERPTEPVPSQSSRRGGAILLGLVVLVVVIVVVVLLVSGGSSSPTKSGSHTASGGTRTTAATTGGEPQVLQKIDLVSPSGSASLKGAADVVRVKGQLGLVLIAVGLTPDTTRKFAYAVWLKNLQTGAATRLGFYNQLVAASGASAGKLEAEVKLGSHLSDYNEVLLTEETKPNPTTPGVTVLEGAFAE